MTLTRSLAAAVAAAASLAVAVPTAGAATLQGKTKGGNTITLKRSGQKISTLKTAVPTMCVETTGSGMSRAGVELFEPPGSFTIGTQRKTKALQEAAMNLGIEATKNYTVKLNRSSGQTVSGKLSVNFSFMIPDLFRTMPYIYMCQGVTTFTAR